MTRKSLRARYDAALSRAVSLARREFPNLVGIQVHGSVARGEPGPFSDIDLLCVYRGGKKPSDFSYFDGDIYVGVVPINRSTGEGVHGSKVVLLGSRKRKGH